MMGRLKKELHAATSPAMALETEIARDPQWSWANKKHGLKELRHADNAVAAFKDSPAFYKDWVEADNCMSVMQDRV